MPCQAKARQGAAAARLVKHAAAPGLLAVAPTGSTMPAPSACSRLKIFLETTLYFG